MQENCTLNVISVASIIAPELDIYAIPNDDKTLHVYDARLILLLSEIFRVPYRIFIPQDGEFGSKLPDGNWSGIVGMVIRSETDLAVGGTALSEDSFHAVNFSYPYLFTDYTFMTDKLKPVSRNSALLNPFPLKLWITLIAIIFFFSFLIFFLTNKTRRYTDFLLRTYGTLLENTTFRIELQKTSHRLLICAWLIFSFVITNSYKAVFLSFLTLPNFTGIRDIADLVQASQRNLVTCYSFNNKRFAQKLLESRSDRWKLLGKCLQQNDIAHGAVDSFLKAKPGKVFITGRIYLQPYKQRYFISEDSIFTAMYAFPLSRIFSCKKAYLNKKIHQLFAAGIFEKINKDEELQIELKLLKTNINEPDGIKALQIEDLKSAFLVLLYGYILSSIVFAIEIAVNYYFPNKHLYSNYDRNISETHRKRRVHF